MAINYTISYTFTPGTTISSSQVNTNFSDNANTWTGLEGLTKSFSNLRVDATPTTATDVAIKSYVDKLDAYRRPTLVFGNVTTVAVEAGLDGTSGNIPLLFPDGTLRTETSTTRTTFNITRNAVLTTAGAQSGLTGATSEAANTWYALYGCKVTDSSTQWVTVGSTVLPLQANFSTLNTAYGTNGWVYLGMVRNGDNSGATTDLLSFTMKGAWTAFNNVNTTNGEPGFGVILKTATSAASSSMNFAAGTGAGNIPDHINLGCWQGFFGNPGGSFTGKIQNNAATATYVRFFYTSTWAVMTGVVDLTAGMTLSSTSNVAYSFGLISFIDGVLGIGANPVL